MTEHGHPSRGLGGQAGQAVAAHEGSDIGLRVVTAVLLPDDGGALTGEFPEVFLARLEFGSLCADQVALLELPERHRRVPTGQTGGRHDLGQVLAPSTTAAKTRSRAGSANRRTTFSGVIGEP
nr:hypothetical protein GCM10020241_10170 [Streptoalloteichus tenebrarius]